MPPRGCANPSCPRNGKRTGAGESFTGAPLVHFGHWSIDLRSGKARTSRCASPDTGQQGGALR